MIRQAVREDIPQIVEIYDKILSNEEAGKVTIGWARGVYPTEQTALDALEKGTLFVCEDADAEGNSRVVAAAKIDQTQVPEYADCRWEHQVPDDQVMVLHTLVVDPVGPRRGYGKAFVKFYEEYALSHGCRYLRMDTNERNVIARKLYAKLGYKEPGIVSCVFNGIPNVRLVCLEKKL